AVETTNDLVQIPTTYAVPKARIGIVDLDAVITRVAVSDLETIRKVAGRDDYFGILGMDFLASWVLEIDFDRGELCLRKKLDAVPKIEPIAMTTRWDKLPEVQAELTEWGKRDFLIDTGDTGYDSGHLESRSCNYILQVGAAMLLGKVEAQSLSG